MSRRRRAGALVASVIGAAGLFWGAVALGAVDPSATTRPTRLERAEARAVLDAAVRARAPRGRTAPADRASVERGREAYRAHCLVCHGVPGGAQSSIAAGLNPSLSSPRSRGPGPSVPRERARGERSSSPRSRPARPLGKSAPGAERRHAACASSMAVEMMASVNTRSAGRASLTVAAVPRTRRL